MSYDENEPTDYDGHVDYVTGRAPGLDGKTYVDGTTDEFVTQGVSEGPVCPTWDKATPEQIRADLAAFAQRGRERYRNSSAQVGVSIPPKVARIIGWDPAADGKQAIAVVGGQVLPMKIERVEFELPEWTPPTDVMAGFAKTLTVGSGWKELTRMAARVLLGPDWVHQQEALEAWEGEGGAL